MCSRLKYEEIDSGVLQVKRLSKFAHRAYRDMMKEEDRLEQNNTESLPSETKIKTKYPRAHQPDDVEDQQLFVVKKEEDIYLWRSSLDQQDMEHVYLKKEEDTLWTNPEGEQLQVKSEDDEEPEVLQLHPIKTKDDKETEPLTISSDSAGLKAEWQPDDQQLLVVKKEEDPHLWSSSLDQQHIEPVHVKKEEDQLWTNQEEEQLTVKSEDVDKPEILKLHPIKTEDKRETEPLTITSAEQMERETNGDHCGGPDRNIDPNINLQTNTVEKASYSSETEDSSDDADYWKKTVSVSASAKEDIDKDWRETLTPKLGAKSNRGSNTANCLECCKTFPNKRHFQKHVTTHSGEGPSSLVAKKCSPKKQNEDSKLKVTNEDKSFASVDCGKIFRTTPQLEYHLRLHRVKKPFRCGVCNKKFGRRGNLKKHMLIHEEEKTFACSHCDKRYKYRSYLLAHMTRHSEEKPFQCGVYDKTSGLQGTLNQHMLIHKEVKPFACSYCDKRYKIRRDLQAHMTSHTGEKPFCCCDCDTVFSRRESLNRHVRLHKGESPYACDKCDKIFLQMSHLKRHMLIHLKDKVSVKDDEVPAKPRPFSCEECGKKFFQKSHLTVHMTVHTRKKPFSCDVCGVSFTRKDTWGRHKIKFHNK